MGRNYFSRIHATMAADLKKKSKKSSVVPAKKSNAKGTATKAKKNPMFIARKKNFGFGMDKPYKKNMNHLVKFPRYVILQRRLKTIKNRLQQPPQIQQFSNYIDRPTKIALSDFLSKHQNETKLEKKIRIKTTIKNEVAKGDNAKKQKIPAGPSGIIKSGVQEVTRAITQKRAKLVVIAVCDPIYIVAHLPSLCYQHNIAYCIVPDRGWLGKQINERKVSCIAITEPKTSISALENLVKVCRTNYNDNYLVARTTWGEGELSSRAERAKTKKENIIKMNDEKSKTLKLDV